MDERGARARANEMRRVARALRMAAAAACARGTIGRFFREHARTCERTLRGLRFSLKFLWHLLRQKRKTVESLRTKTDPWPG